VPPLLEEEEKGKGKEEDKKEGRSSTAPSPVHISARRAQVLSKSPSYIDASASTWRP
jgi:hypothetical protein